MCYQTRNYLCSIVQVQPQYGRLWAFITAVCLWIEECVYAQFVAEVEAIAANAIPNTATWLRSMLYRFQYGHDLLFDDYRPYYAIDDAAARICLCKPLVVETTWGIVLVKVAKNGVSGLQPLTTLEIQAVEVYVDDIKPAGTLVQVISLNPDKLKVMADIYYDPLINLSTLKTNIEKAIKGYLRNLPFDCGSTLTALEDAIQKSSRRENVEVKLCRGTSWGSALCPNNQRHSTRQTHIHTNFGLYRNRLAFPIRLHNNLRNTYLYIIMVNFYLQIIPLTIAPWRKDKMHQWIWANLQPLQSLHAIFEGYRNETKDKLQVTTQTYSLEWYLNRVFNPSFAPVISAHSIILYIWWHLDREQSKSSAA